MLEYKFAVRAMLNNLKTSSDGGDTGSKKYKWDCWRLWRGLTLYAFVLSLESGVRRPILFWSVQD